MDVSKIFPVAEKAANHLLKNQVTDRLDANKGRTLSEYEEATNYVSMTTSWQTGAVAMGLLAMYKRTGDKKYLEAAELAGHYIMSLQVMDQRREQYYGVIRECTPQSIEFCPRDATTAAWGLVWLYEATHDEEYLDHAVRYAEWHLKYGMCEGWPKWAVFMDKTMPDFYARGSFQSGTGLFYHDLFLQTGDTRYVEFGLKPIAQLYRDNYFQPNGQIILERHIFTDELSTRQGNNIEGELHSYNDDFGNPMLLAAADIFKDESYRECARKFAHWLADHQKPNGGFNNGVIEIPSAVPMALMYYHELGEFYHDEKLLAARDKTLDKLIQMQLHDESNIRLDGAFEGTPDCNNVKADPRRSTNVRTTQYALIALLKLEGKVNNIWLGGNLNEGFKDPLDDYSKHPYKLIW